MQCCEGKKSIKMQLSQFQWKLLISRNLCTCGYFFFFFPFELSRPIYSVVCSCAGLLSDSCNPGEAAVIVSQMTPVFHTTIWELLDSAHSSHLSHLLLWPLEIPEWNSAIFGWRVMDETASFVIYQHFPYQCSLNGIRLDRKEPILDAGKHPDLVIISFFTLVHVRVLWKISRFSNQKKREAFPALFLKYHRSDSAGYQPQQLVPTPASIMETQILSDWRLDLHICYAAAISFK